MITCPQCNTPNQDNATNCVNCGNDLSPAGNARAAMDTTQAIEPAGSKDTTIAVGPAGTQTAVISGNTNTTQIIPQAVPFAPLPEGAIIGQPPHEYQVEKLKKQEEGQHTYQVVSVDKFRICPECGYLFTPAGETGCRFCQTALDESPPVQLHTTMLESAQVDAFSVEAHLAERKLETPFLRLPPVVLTKRVGGRERRYLVEAPPPAEWLDALPPPQELINVLEWGVNLAQALSLLHEHQVAFGPFEGSRVGLEAKRASLAEFSKCYYPGREALYQQDIRQLAAFLIYLHTGSRRYSNQLELPQPVQDVLLRAIRDGHPYHSAAAFATAMDELLADIRRPVSLDYIIGRRTDVGQSRKLNEDSMLSLNLVLSNQSVSHPLGVFAVADGMGGHSAGEMASGLALTAVSRSAIEDLLTLDTNSGQIAFSQWVNQAVSAANTAVNDYMRATEHDLGTTLVLVLLVNDHAYLANVGDSRAYLVTADSFQQITVDHSLVERLVATGQITPEEARYHPQRNVIYRTIGDKPNVEADTWEIQLQPGDQLLLCSDGLCGMLEDQRMWDILRQAKNPQSACDALVNAANQAGGTDNITAVIVQLVQTADGGGGYAN